MYETENYDWLACLFAYCGFAMRRAKCIKLDCENDGRCMGSNSESTLYYSSSPRSRVFNHLKISFFSLLHCDASKRGVNLAVILIVRP